MISVVVPVYNVEKELPRCVESILNQSHADLELILVDDGSPDSCPAMCDSYGQADSRVKVVHKPNGGLSSARNAGLKCALGDYILFVDSDDYLELDACERLYASAVELDADIVAGEMNECRENGIIERRHTNLDEHRAYTPADFIVTCLQRWEWYAPACLNLCKRSFLFQNELFFKEGILHEDMEYQPRLFLKAKRVGYVSGHFYNYVIRPGSIMTDACLRERRAASLGRIYADWKKTFDDVEDPRLQKFLYGHLAKCYLHSCRELNKHRGLDVDGVSAGFLIKTGIGMRERAKAILFATAGRLYCRLGR